MNSYEEILDANKTPQGVLFEGRQSCVFSFQDLLLIGSA